MPARSASPTVATVVLALSGTAWMVLWWFGDAPWTHAMHGHPVTTRLPAGLAPASPPTVPFSLFVAGWTVMTTAMMLPTTLPLVHMFRRLTATRRDRTRLVVWLLTGYLVAWGLFGVVVFAVLAATRHLFAVGELARAAPYALTAALFALAGAFQLSSLKYRCLDQCRSPLSFLTARWRGGHDTGRSFRIGAEHGLLCVGCCWALMLLMFAFGTFSVVWMFALAAVMALEKNSAWGRRLSTPLGYVLIGIGGVAALLPWLRLA